ncbi:MAG: hypothetical protein IBJ05_08085, partial [Blastomonas sp.]|nr:hypothetical protein [Blastomonas sp.]
MRATRYSGLVLGGLALLAMLAGQDAALAQAEVKVRDWASIQKDEALPR